MRCEWEKIKLEDMVVFNPKLSLPKGSLAKKVAMEHLLPFSKYITKFELSRYAGGAKFMNGDTLLARITPCLENGKTSQVTMLEEDEIGFGSTEFIVLRAKDGISDKDFIYYLSISPQFRDYAIKSMVGSSGRQRVQQDVLENMYIDCPSIPEQKAIAAVLSALDDKIELNNRINRNLEAQAQAIFKSWFVDFEPFRDGEFVDSELGPIPKGWRVGNIYEVADVIYGAPFKSALFNNEQKGYPLIRIRDLKTFTPQFFTEESLPKQEIVYPGDIVAGMDAEFIPVIWQGETGLLNQRVLKLKPKETAIDSYFLLQLVKPELEFIQSYKVGTTVSHLGKSDIDRLIFILPSRNLIIKYSKLIKPIHESITRLSEENRILVTLRDTLLPKLMSGEIEVPTT